MGGLNGAPTSNTASSPPVAEVPLFEHYTRQAVTPIDERRSYYTFSWGPSTRCGSKADADLMESMLMTAFTEDKVMIEAQQKIIDRDPTRTVMPIAADKGVILFNRLMERLMRAE